jgi:hypothetical protein
MGKKSFNQFIPTEIREIDFIVGYKGDNMEEIRVSVSTLLSLLRGQDGKSVQIQFSQTGQSWHYPDADGDQYMRIKVGNEPFSNSFKIRGDAGKDGVVAVQYSADGVDFDDAYHAGDAYIRFRLETDMYGLPVPVVGVDGDKGEAGVDGKNIELQTTATHIQWRVVGGTWANLIALSELKGAKGDKGDTGDKGDGIPDEWGEGDILFIDPSSNLPIWLKGSYDMQIEGDSQIYITEYARNITIIHYENNNDIQLYFNSEMFNLLENIDILIVNPSETDKFIWLDENIMWENGNSAIVKAQGTIEFSVRPYRDFDSQIKARGITG